MKNFILTFLLPFVMFSVVATGVAETVHESTGIPVEVTYLALVGGVLFVAAIHQGQNRSSYVFKQAVEVEVWANYIIERLWKTNSFLQHAFSDDDKVLAGKLVHIPNPGAKPEVVKNRQVYPIAAVRRGDTDIVYVLDEYSTGLTHIPDAEKVELSYDKIDSVYGDHAGVLMEDVAGDACYKWLVDLPQASIITTSGGNTSDILDGASGTRKVLVHADLRKAQKLMNKQSFAAEDRFTLLTSDMADQLFESLSNTQYRDFSQYADAKEGIIGRLYGFNIMQRSDIATAEYSSAFSINPYGTAVDTGTRDVSFCWQKNAVARALGETKFYENENRAEYQGDVYSARIRFGGRRRREDNAGVIALIQGS